MFFGNMLKCKKLNERLCIYDMVDLLKTPILRDHNDINDKFRCGGGDNTLYLLDHMNALTLDHVLLCQKETNTYAEHDAYISKWLNALLIASSTDELNIRVNEIFDLLPIIEHGGIIRLKIILDEIFFMAEAVVQALNTRLKHFPQE